MDSPWESHAKVLLAPYHSPCLLPLDSCLLPLRLTARSSSLKACISSVLICVICEAHKSRTVFIFLSIDTILRHMGVETEKKFLVKKDLWNKVKKGGTLYRQGYMLREENKTIRIRLIEGDQGYITIKGKAKGFSRPEYEYPIPGKDAEELLQNFCDAVVSKRRYKINIEGKLWEVDEFLGDNEGLIVAELELDNETEQFNLPEWIATEVSGDQRYYNSELSVNPFKNWKQ